MPFARQLARGHAAHGAGQAPIGGARNTVDTPCARAYARAHQICLRPPGGPRTFTFGNGLVAAGRKQRRVKITPGTAGTFGCLVVAVLGYGAVTIIDRSHLA